MRRSSSIEGCGGVELEEKYAGSVARLKKECDYQLAHSHRKLATAKWSTSRVHSETTGKIREKKHTATAHSSPDLQPLGVDNSRANSSFSAG